MKQLKTLSCLAIVFLMLCSAIAGAADEEMFRDQARCYTTWDGSYFYLAFQVDCPDVQATHSRPNAPYAGDDAVEFYVQTKRDRAETIGPSCYSMGVSAANGSQFREGDESGELKPKTVTTFRYSATIQGTPNNSDDVDMGYTIEIAIPWELVNLKAPTMGDMMGFNILIRRHGEKGGFVSLSPDVQSEEDVLNPSKWSSIVFTANTFGVATTGRDKVLSPRYVVRAPLVDGNIGEKEYHRNTSFALDMPLPEGYVYSAKFPAGRLVFTHYFYWYQADARKQAPLSHITHADGLVILQDFPDMGAGPWFTYDRVQWHKGELQEIAAAGIDAVLPIYWGDKFHRAGFSLKGLDCMVSALQELEQEGKPYPLVAMFFDTSAMTLAYGENPDLKSEEVQRAFYGMIRDFFNRVPEEYRALTQAGEPDAGQAANIVFLYTSYHFSGMDSSFIEYCNQRYKAEFGRPLVWVGSGDCIGKANFDGYSSYGAGLNGVNSYDNGRIRLATLGAGFDNSAFAAQGEAQIRSRMGGETYAHDWELALGKNPEWIVCDGWNEFHEGSDLCTSREFGRRYVDATAAGVRSFRGGRDYDAQYLRWNVPKVIPSKQFAQAEVLIRNVGGATWNASDQCALAYRWYKKGRYFGESKVRRPLGRDVAPGETIAVTIGVATVNVQGGELPPGDCEIRFELIRESDGKWFSTLGDQPLVVPVTIAPATEWAAEYVSCDAPAMVATGQAYPVTVRARNDGSQTWSKGASKLGVRLYRSSSHTHDGDELMEEVPIRDVRVLLGKDCKPGEIAEFQFDLTLTAPDGKPLEQWKQNASWTYLLRFDLYNGSQWLSELQVRPLSRGIAIFEKDYGPRIVDCDIPRVLDAGQTVKTKVVLSNAGRTTWDRKRTQIGCHWYHLDGTEMLWDGQTTRLPANVQPGWPVVVEAEVKAPEYDGRYVLVWDMLIDGEWLSTGPLSRGGDILPVAVEVKGGRFAFANLDSLCDVVACSPDTDLTSADFDGKGTSFPAELFPPDFDADGQVGLVYPTGYKWDREPRPEGRVSFRYPAKAVDLPNAIACSGQKVDVEDGSYSALYLLGASVDGDSQGQISVNYASGAAEADVAMSDWGAGPQHGEEVGYCIRHRHTHGGDDRAARCYLYTYRIPLDASRRLTSITLPDAAGMRVVAATLERPALPAKQ